MNARESYETALRLHKQGRAAEAEPHYRAALAAVPNHLETIVGIGLVCLQTGKLEEAQYRFEQVLAADPNHPQALMGLGDVLAARGRQNEAVVLYQRLIKAQPDNVAAHSAIGQAQKQLGAFAESREAFAHAVALAPDNPHLHYALAESAPFTPGDPRLPALEALLPEETHFSNQQRAELHFALFKAYDELKRPSEAFAELEKGNRIYRALVPYDEAEVITFFHEVQETYTREAITEYSGAGHPSDLPVFVVGMPRSGTTLVEQILASHPDVFGAGELLYLQDLIFGGFAGPEYPLGLADLGPAGLKAFGGYYAVRLSALSPRAKRITDKLPANFIHAGLIHLALPKAHIIHIRRNPIDTCFSCYTKLFANGVNHAYDLGELGRYYKRYQTLMAHWRTVLPQGVMLEVQYESLVTDFAREARRIIAFCGLEWDDRCLRFHEAKRAVRTFSEFQVRKPLYASSIERWRTYEPWLGPLLAALR